MAHQKLLDERGLVLRETPLPKALAGALSRVGLLGTVLGMFRAFGGIATDVAAGAKPVVLAQGVSQAIVTTIFGLAIAIPCLLCHAYFRRRAMKRIAEIEELAQ